ncbi:DUF6979 family protein [Shewanella sp. YLB-07]|uniref:DUF6979 family protein n=1 Tax=Shewanella sp. YLB-07 TaxID=2601268 RepID=UPI00128CBD67|nr:hypothetical protein [Shewanella sp. YLB-07]MPY23832.1 hypothetical protein [Shewanella sp. YLB-07]
MTSGEHGSYGSIALKAMSKIQDGFDPVSAWEFSAREHFSPKQVDSIKKGCPKSTFLGLCEYGKVKGVDPSAYTRSKINKQHAKDAYDLLKLKPHLDKNALWLLVAGNKTHNHQMDVLFALYESGALCE